MTFKHGRRTLHRTDSNRDFVMSPLLLFFFQFQIFFKQIYNFMISCYTTPRLKEAQQILTFAMRSVNWLT